MKSWVVAQNVFEVTVSPIGQLLRMGQMDNMKTYHLQPWLSTAQRNKKLKEDYFLKTKYNTFRACKCIHILPEFFKTISSE